MFRSIVYWVIAAALFAWLSIIIASGAGWNPIGVEWNFANPGAFGDSFGPMSALMASVAAVSAIAAYRSQREEIERLRDRELEEDRRRESEDKLRRQRESQEDRRRDKAERLRKEAESRDDARARISAFEGTFFQLLEAFRIIVSETDVGGMGSRKVARDAFKSMVHNVQNHLSTKPTISLAWKETSSYYENDLNHYFRFLYHLIKFVDVSEIVDKYFYVRLIRSNLSESELILIALNCAYGEGKDKFRPLVERYSLLHNISVPAQARWKLREHFGEDAFEHK